MAALKMERQATRLIAWITIVTGASQIAFPGPLLMLLGVPFSPATAQLFATVGLFMILFGGAVLHGQARPQALPVVLVWAGLQKIGASLLVGWGVSRGIFAPVSLLVSAFDFASGLVYFDLRRRELGR